MLATVRTTVLPDFSVEVYPTAADEHTVHQRYVLILRDGVAGALELVFPSAQDFQAFLTDAREAFASAKYEAKARKARLNKRPVTSFSQTTLF